VPVKNRAQRPRGFTHHPEISGALRLHLDEGGMETIRFAHNVVGKRLVQPRVQTARCQAPGSQRRQAADGDPVPERQAAWQLADNEIWQPASLADSDPDRARGRVQVLVKICRVFLRSAPTCWANVNLVDGGLMVQRESSPTGLAGKTVSAREGLKRVRGAFDHGCSFCQALSPPNAAAPCWKPRF
jgi:hypothetical protein